MFGGYLEATAGIEPAFTDLQSAASPLRHVATPSVSRNRPPIDMRPGETPLLAAQGARRTGDALAQPPRQAQMGSERACDLASPHSFRDDVS